MRAAVPPLLHITSWRARGQTFSLFYSLVLSANVNSFHIPSSASLPTIFPDAMKTLVPQNTRQTIMFSNKAITMDTVL